MTWEFKPGMKVVCVVANFVNGKDSPLVEGQVYTLSHVCIDLGSATTPFGVVCNHLTVRLKETHNPHDPKDLFDSRRFRPLQTQFTSLLNSIVAGVNDGKLVVEDGKYMENFRRKKQNV